MGRVLAGPPGPEFASLGVGCSGFDNCLHTPLFPRMWCPSRAWHVLSNCLVPGLSATPPFLACPESRQEALDLAKQLAAEKGEQAKVRAAAARMQEKLEAAELQRADAEVAVEQLQQRLERLLDTTQVTTAFFTWPIDQQGHPYGQSLRK